MTNRFLITGAQGFVGRYALAALLNAGRQVNVLGLGRSKASFEHFTHEVTLVDRRIPAPLPENLRAAAQDLRYRYVQLNLLDREAMTSCIRGFEPNVIFHLASGLRDDPADCLIRTNIHGTVDLIEAIRSSGVLVTKVVFASSGGIYGSPTHNCLPLSEDTRGDPVDLYSATKLAAEHVSRILCSQYAIPAVWARIFNIVGPGQDERHLCGQLISQLAVISRRKAGALHVGGLATTRDYIDVRDTAQALILLARKGVVGKAYNVSTGEEKSVRSVVEAAIEGAGFANLPIEIGRPRDHDIPRHVGSIARLKALGFAPRFSLEQSLKDSFSYYCHYSDKCACETET